MYTIRQQFSYLHVYILAQDGSVLIFEYQWLRRSESPLEESHSNYQNKWSHAHNDRESYIKT
jgi:hypothetical protein